MVLRLLDTDPIVCVDDRAVAGERTAVAAIVAAHHADTGVVPVEHGSAIGRLSPRRIAETHALAPRARCADELEFIARARPQNARRVTAPGERQAEPAPVRVGSAQ